MKVFKKYSNRKLYSCDESKYVNLNDIFMDVKKGFTVSVLSHSSGKDITNEVLKEAIIKHTLLSNEVLVNLVKTEENNVS